MLAIKYDIDRPDGTFIYKQNIKSVFVFVLFVCLFVFLVKHIDLLTITVERL